MAKKTKKTKKTRKTRKIRKDSNGYELHIGEYQRSDGRYQFSYMGWDGLRYWVYENSLTKLREREKQIRKEIDNGIDPGAADRTTLNQLFDLYISQAFHLQDQTRFNYKDVYDRHIRGGFGKRKLSKIHYTDIKKFYQSLVEEKKLSVRTLENIHTPLNQAFKVAVKDGVLDRNPCESALTDIKKGRDWNKKTRQALFREQQDAFMNHIRSNSKYAGWVPILTVLLGTGMRIGECLALRWSDIDLETNMINVNLALSNRQYGKGHAEKHVSVPKTKASIRAIPMLDEVRQAFLEEYEVQSCIGFCEEEIDGYSGFIFANDRGFAFSAPSINRFIERARLAYNKEETEKAQTEEREPLLIPHFSCHVLRHTFCTRCVEAGIELIVLKEIMGHSNLQTTLEVYTSISNDKKKQSIDNLNGKIL